MSRVLVTGGAGYVGSILVGQLLDRGYKVKVIDNLRKGGQGLFPYLTNPNLEFIKADVRDPVAVEQALNDIEIVIHLAAIVGQSACDKDPWMARQVNLDGIKNIIDKRSKQQLVIFPSTSSNYGTVVSQECNEEMELKPISLYAVTKLEGERQLLNAGNVIILRPSTAFGFSLQMRLDLLINDFVYKAIKERRLVLFEPNFMRSFIHVRDFSEGLIFSMINADKMRNKIYNLGDESLNVTKKDLAERIKQKVDFDIQISNEGNDPDKRNYKISFSKIKMLGYRTCVSLDQGIEELVHVMPILEIKTLFNNPSYY